MQQLKKELEIKEKLEKDGIKYVSEPESTTDILDGILTAAFIIVGIGITIFLIIKLVNG